MVKTALFWPATSGLAVRVRLTSALAPYQAYTAFFVRFYTRISPEMPASTNWLECRLPDSLCTLCVSSFQVVLTGRCWYGARALANGLLTSASVQCQGMQYFIEKAVTKPWHSA